MRRHIKTLKEKYRNLRRWERITVSLLIIAVISLIVVVGKKPASPFTGADLNTPKEVIVRSVASLSLDKEPLNLIGIVQSESQVDLRSESSGNITNLLVRLDQRVGAGQIIAEIENSRERAAVSQAQALVDAQEAQLLNLKESFSSSGDTVAVQNAYRNLLSSGLVAEPEDKDNTLSAPIISGAYNGSEQGFYNIRISRTGVDKYEFYLKGLEKIRETEIENNSQLSSPLGTRGLSISFPGDLGDYVNTTWVVNIPNTKSASYSTNLSAYNSALDGQRGLKDQVLAQEAQVQSARSSLQAAQAQLEKTIVRSPISGTVTTLNIDRGDFVSAFELVAVVANENQLEVRTYITENDKKSIEVGLPVLIAGEYEGVVTSVAPAVDPATKKIEVSISLGEEEDLLNGQSVSVAINRRDVEEEAIDQIFIPLSSLKVTAEGVVVFSVEDGGLVTKHIVKEGPLVGDKVLILEGLTPDMQIITDVRGIKAGDIVKVVE